MDEGPIKPKTAGARFGTLDKVHNERKQQIFKALQTLVEQEKAKDPNFNLTMKNLGELVAAHKDMFPEGINTAGGVLGYWQVAGGLNYIKEKLGLPFKKIKDEDY